MVIETEFIKLKQEMRAGFAELRKLIMGRNIVGNWVMQPIACAMLNVSSRQLRNIRIHLDKDGNRKGSIRWRKGSGKSVQYHKADIEDYLNKYSVS